MPDRVSPATQSQKRDDPPSMIDVVFQLMIFFLCVSEMVKADYEALVLPIARNGVDEDGGDERRVVVNVTHNFTREGRTHSEIVVRGRRYPDPAELKRLFEQERGRAEAAKRPMMVKIRAAAAAPYERVQRVMSARSEAGIEKVAIGATAKTD
ncbi:MAG: biopolymer transporter ExbD [Planctomycetes bacterium]|nr:biopolymer transporter ExbD [Planctomycetota bacterium]